MLERILQWGEWAADRHLSTFRPVARWMRRRAEFAEGRAFRVDSGGLEAGQPAERLQTIAAAQPGARHRFPQPLDR
jgi:hypothetical protein